MKKLILYDFDGVIVDSFPISFGILREKNPQITEQYYRDCFLGNFYEEGMRGRPDIVWGAPEEFFFKVCRQANVDATGSGHGARDSRTS